MSNEMAVKEIQAKFTADMSGFRKAMEEATKPARSIQEAISKVGETMETVSHLSTQEMQTISRELTNAGKQAARFGSQAQTLVAQGREFSRSVEEQKTKLASLRTEYESTSEKIQRLSGIYDTIQQATTGLDLSTPLAKQREQASAEMDQYRQEILALQSNIAAAQANGSNKVSISWGNNKGYEASVEKAKQKLQQLIAAETTSTNQFLRLGSAIRAIGEENLDFASKSGLKALQDQIGNAKGHLSQLELQAGQTQSRLTGYGERLETVRMKQQALESETSALTTRLSELDSELAEGAALDTPYQRAVQQLFEAQTATQGIRNTFSSLGASIGGAFGTVLATVAHPIRSINVAIGSLGQRISQAFSSAATVVKSTLTNGLQMAGKGVASFAGKLLSMAPGVSVLKGIVDRLRGVKSGGEGAASGLNGMVKSIRNIGLVSVGLKLAGSLFGRLRSVVSQYLTENAAAQTAVNNLKSAFANALAPAINIAINALNAILPYIQAVSNAFATLFTNLFGAQWTTISGGASGAADAVGGVADATKGAAAAQEEYNRTLAGFDQITKLDDSSSSGGSGGSGGGSGGGGATTSTIGGGEGLLGQFSQFMEDVAGLFKSGQWAELGTYLAEAFGSAIDTAYGFLTSQAVYDKIGSAIDALAATVNSFFARLTLIDTDSGNSIAEKTGATLGAAINLAFYTVNSFLTSINWGSIGLAIAQFINGAVKETDWSQIGTTIANWFLTLPKILYSAIVNTDWGAVATGISDGIMAALSTVNDWLATVDWSAIGQSVADFLLGIDWLGIAGEIVEFFVSGFSGLAEALAAVITGIGTSVGLAIADAFTTLLDNASATLEALKKFLGGIDLLAILTGDTSSLTKGWNEFTLSLSAIWTEGSEAAVDKYNGVEDKSASAKMSGKMGPSAMSKFEVFNGAVSGSVSKTLMTSMGPGPESALNLFKSTVSGAATRTLRAVQGSGYNSIYTYNSTKNDTASKLLKAVQGAGFGYLTTYANAKTDSVIKTLVGKRGSNYSILDDYNKIGNRTVTTTVNVNTPSASSVVNTYIQRLNSNFYNNPARVYVKLPQIKYSTSSSGMGIPKATSTMVRLAQGGIVDRATPAIFGEDGPEAVMPLKNNTQWISMLADQLNARQGGGKQQAQPITLNVYIGGEKMTTTVIDDINRITRQTGACPIYV